MKIRNGFVSNSSSSSFIVVFPRAPESAQDVHEILFGAEEKKLGQIYHAYDDKWVLPSRWAAELIWKDIEAQKEPKPDFIEWVAGDLEQALDEYDYERKQTVLTTFVEAALLQKPIYYFTYADNGSTAECILESGEAFENVKYTKISHH